MLNDRWVYDTAATQLLNKHKWGTTHYLAALWRHALTGVPRTYIGTSQSFSVAAVEAAAARARTNKRTPSNI